MPSFDLEYLIIHIVFLQDKLVTLVTSDRNV